MGQTLIHRCITIGSVDGNRIRLLMGNSIVFVCVRAYCVCVCVYRASICGQKLV